MELVYDLNYQPSVRFIEGLWYESPHYKQASQAIALSLVENDDRPFVFSTPRLPSPGRLHLNVRFCDSAVDELFKTKRIPQTLGYLKEILGITDSDELLSSFFTDTPPAERPRYSGSDVVVRYFGHACLLIESRGTSILCDPVISYQHNTKISRYTYADLPDTIDYILITHNHQDHCLLETLLQLRHKVRNVIVPRSNGGGLADPSLKLALRKIGFSKVREIDEMESIAFEDGEILSLPFLGEHADINIRTKTAYLVRIKNRSILMAADSNNIEPRLYDHIHASIGDIDVLFLGMECDGAPLSWVYGPLMTKSLSRQMDQSRRFDGSDCKKGMDIVKRLNPKQVYVYAMGQEPWLTYLTAVKYTPESRPIVESDMLIENCRSMGIPAERIYCQKELLMNADQI